MSNTRPDAPAQRLHSIIAAASSLALRTPGSRAHLIGRHALDGNGRIRIDLPADSELAGEVTRQRELVAIIEVTDLAPTPVRDRVRAHASLSGWLTPAAVHQNGNGEPELSTVLDLAAAELTVDGTVSSVEPDEFAAAEPDPLATEEAELLCHLDHHHPRTVAQLTRLVDPRHRYGVRRVLPVRLDQHGLVLRLERARNHRDVRLDFTPALRNPDELGARIAVLLDAAACHRRPRTRSR